MTTISNEEIKTIMYLSACALNNEKPNADILKSTDFEKLFKLANFHSMTAIICMALESGGLLSEDYMLPKEIAKWKRSKDIFIRKNMLLDAERKEICKFMESKGIWYMPLKGVILKELYPKIGMRQMADNDILYDVKYQDDIKKYMISNGYKAENVGKGAHDSYTKKPLYNFEMHRVLFCAAHNPIWVSYYEDVKNRLVKDSDSNFGYHFTDEDFYIYILAHAFKHYDGGGTGFRILLDVYVYMKSKANSLDWNYINNELKKLEIAEFESQCRSLSEKLLSNPRSFNEIKLSEDERKVLLYISGSGTYGTIKNKATKDINKIKSERNIADINVAKRKYYFQRLFPDMQWYKMHKPFIYKHRWLIPFFVPYRAARGLILRGDKIKSEIRTVNGISES